MGKIKKFLLIIFAVCCVAACAAGAVACKKDKDKSSAPDFINPTGSVITPGDDGDEAITVYTRSTGGIPLDGVTVNISAGGRHLYSGISSDGMVSFPLPAGSYELSYETLPAGYSQTENTAAAVTPDSTEVTAYFTSSVISETVPQNKIYSVGDIMYDFRVTDSDGNTIVLSKLFETKKLVVINFWYVECSWCITEFPAIQGAYEKFRDDVEIVALSDRDSNSAISRFKRDMGLTFPMARDVNSLYQRFTLQGFPTSIWIDRYGVIAKRDDGAVPAQSNWEQGFATYTSDNYTQNIVQGGTDAPDSNAYALAPEGNENPSSEQFNEAISSGFDFNYFSETGEDAPYTWAWKIEDGHTVVPTNLDVRYSYATFYVNVPLNRDEAFSFEYKTNLAAGQHTLYVVVDDVEGEQLTGDSGGWRTLQVYAATRPCTITVGIMYMNTEEAGSTAAEEVAVRNLKVENLSLNPNEDNDIKRDVISYNAGGAYTGYNGEKYDKLEISAAPGADGIYRINTSEDSYLYADLTQTTLWSDLRMAKSFTPNGESAQTSSLYLLAFWNMSNRAEDDAPLHLYFDDVDDVLTHTLIDNYYASSSTQYTNLVPVTEDVKQLIIEFTKYYCEQNNETYYEDQWLEFCSYYQHIGPNPNHPGCLRTFNTVLGTSFETPIEINEAKTYTFSNMRLRGTPPEGSIYKFTAPLTGAYRIASLIPNDSATMDPRVIICDKAVEDLWGKDIWDGAYVADCAEYFGYDRDERRLGYNFEDYFYLAEGDYIYFLIGDASNTSGNRGASFDFEIEWTGLTYHFLRVATTGNGAFTTNNSGGLYYISVPSYYDAASDRYYRTYDDGNTGSVMYIDFTHSNYYDGNGHSLLEFLDQGWGGTSTAKLREYYNASIAGRQPSDPLYGMAEATKELVDILNSCITEYDQDADFPATVTNRYWESLACYFEYYGATQWEEVS